MVLTAGQIGRFRPNDVPFPGPSAPATIGYSVQTLDYSVQRYTSARKGQPWAWAVGNLSEHARAAICAPSALNLPS